MRSLQINRVHAFILDLECDDPPGERHLNAATAAVGVWKNWRRELPFGKKPLPSKSTLNKGTARVGQ